MPSTPSLSLLSNLSLPLSFVQELSLPDVPILMTLLDERPSGKLCVSYQKQMVVDTIDEIRATTQRIPNLDIAKVYISGHEYDDYTKDTWWVLVHM